MSVDSENSCILVASRESRTSCIFQTADENDEIPGVGEESVLEMLSYSKFSDLETWLCMPSSVLLSRPLDMNRTCSSCSTLSSNHSSNSPTMSSSSSAASISRRSICSEPGDSLLRSLERDLTFLTPALGKEATFLSTPLLPILSSTPIGAPQTNSGPTVRDSNSSSGVSIRKRRRLAASPGGLHWNSEGSVQRKFWSPDPPSRMAAGGARGRGFSGRSFPLGQKDRVTPVWTAGERVALRKTLSADDQLLRPAGGELKLLNGLERGRKKLRNIHSLGTQGRYDSRKKSCPQTKYFHCSYCLPSSLPQTKLMDNNEFDLVMNLYQDFQKESVNLVKMTNSGIHSQGAPSLSPLYL